MRVRSSCLLLVLLWITGSVPAAARAPEDVGLGQTRADRVLANAHYQSGWKLYRSEAFEEAAREFTKAVALNPEYELAHYGLGRSLMALKRYVEAVNAYRTSKKLFQESIGDRYHNQQERRHRLQDQLRELDELLRVAQAAPPTAQVQNQVRQLQDTQRRIRNNLDRDQNVALDTSVPAFLSLALGSAHFRAGQFAEAAIEYQACIQADPQAGEAWNNLAVIHLLAGRIADAERAILAAERVGYKVNAGLKDEIARRKQS